jgi:conjugal transfer pilus assembly protein TraW
MKKLLTSILVLLMMIQNEALGHDFGKRATSFAIKEEGFIAMIMRKLKQVDLAQEEEKMRQIAKDRVENPLPVAGIEPATVTREFWHDPTYIFTEDVVLPCRKVLHKAGTQVNPLEHMDLERRLFFIDGREEKQIEWVKQHLAFYEKEAKNSRVENRVILVAGSVFRLKSELGGDVYFDQGGELTTQFGIKASPARLEQDGQLLKIEEQCL